MNILERIKKGELKQSEAAQLLKKDVKTWKEMEEEKEEWDVTLKDGLNDDKS